MATETVNINATIADGTIALNKLVDIPEASFIGRRTGSGTGQPIVISADKGSEILDTATDPFVRTSVLPTVVEEDPGPGVGLIESGAGVSPIVLKNAKNGTGTEVVNNTGSFQYNVKFTGANQYHYGDISGDAVEGTITSFARTILDDADAATVRATIGAGTGSGDVVGPASATDNAIARYDLTTGKLIQNSGITIADGATGTLSGTNTGDQDLSPYQTIAALAADVRAVALTGLSLASSAAVAATDTILAAFGKLQAFNNLFTTIGLAYARLTNPGAVTFPRQNADNTVTSRTASEMRTDLEVYASRVIMSQNLTLTNQPNALEIITPGAPGLFINRIDLTNFTEVMFQAQVFVGSASANTPRLILGYSTTYTVVPGSWLTIGSTAVTVSLTTAGVIQSGWVALVAGAKADVYIACLTNGGNAAADPVITGVTAFFR